MKRYLLLLILFTTLSGYAQNTINNYKYVLVPEQYSFLKEVNQYGLNSQTKNLLETMGFTVYFDNKDLPTDLANNKCLAMTADLIEKSGLFTTTLALILKDCQGNVVFQGKVGKSREKEYNASYNEALRMTFISFEELPYAFTGEAENIESAKAREVVVAPENQLTAVVERIEPSETLYAQATASGFQLIDTTPKKVLTLFKTSVQDVFIADNGQVKGIALQKDGKWFFEYYNNDELVSKGLLIKF